MHIDAARESTSTVGSPPGTWKLPTGLMASAALIYGVTASRSALSNDVWTTYFASWRLASTGSPWIEGVRIPELDNNPIKDVWVLHAANGHTVIGRSPGAVLAGMPGYLLTQGTHMSLAPGAWTAALLTALSVTLMFLALRCHLPDRVALLATCAFAFTTPIWSVAANGIWPQTVTVLGVCGMAWASTTGRWWWVGIFGGIALWGRLHALLIVATLGLFLGWRHRNPHILLKVAGTSATFLATLSIWTRWMYGTWNPTGSYDSSALSGYAREYRYSPAAQLGVWIAPDRGLLIWTPVMLLLAPAVARSWRDLPDWSRSLVWGGLIYTVIQSALSSFMGGDAFYGYRYGLEFLSCATPALALASPHMGGFARRVIGPVLAVQFVGIALGSINDHIYLAQAEVWRDNAFVHTIDGAGRAAWVLVSICASIGILIGVLIMRRVPATEDSQEHLISAESGTATPSPTVQS